jgi:signal transduction histidine kinase
MAAITSAASVLSRFVRDDTHMRQASDVITRQIDHLWSLVEDLLDIGRITTGKMVLHRWPMDLDDVVRRCIERLDAAGRTADHDVTYSGEPVWVDADNLRIGQVVDSLLVNALTYTPTGGSVKVTVGLHNRDAILRVEDSGSALDAASLPFVFDVFYQARQGLDRPGEGLGIGLNLVKRLVELHGGTVSVASPGLQQGRTFTVRFPRTAPVGPSQKPVPVPGRERMRHR